MSADTRDTQGRSQANCKAAECIHRLLGDQMSTVCNYTRLFLNVTESFFYPCLLSGVGNLITIGGKLIPLSPLGKLRAGARPRGAREPSLSGPSSQMIGQWPSSAAMSLVQLRAPLGGHWPGHGGSGHLRDKSGPRDSFSAQLHGSLYNLNCDRIA